MKNLIILLSILVSGNLFAGAVGGGGISAMTFDSKKLLQVYQGANNISKEAFGTEHMFELNLKDRTVTFDTDREISDESTVMSFDEVAKYARPSLNVESLLKDAQDDQSEETLNDFE